MKNIYKIMLVNAPNPADGIESGNYAVFPAMGIVNLGTRIRNDYPEIDIAVVDGGNKTTKQIKERIDNYKPSLLAISVLTPTYKQGLELAQYAKEMHKSKIVLGNDHASFFPELILQNRPYTDYVVQAEFGEEPFSYIIDLETGKSGLDIIQIPGQENIYLRTNEGEIKKISFKKKKITDIIRDAKDIPDLSLIEQ